MIRCYSIRAADSFAHKKPDGHKPPGFCVSSPSDRSDQCESIAGWSHLSRGNMLAVIYKPIGDLIPYAMNSRTHSDAQVAQIAASIKEFGFTNPVLIDEEGGIIAGHGRVLAARKLSMDEVPTIALEGLTKTQRKAYVIADNKLALNAGWDEELLKLEIEELQNSDLDLALIGFADVEITNLFFEKLEGETNAFEEWEGMPEFDQPDATSFRQVIVHFDNNEDVAEFFNLIGQGHTDKTKSIWFPKKENKDTNNRRYGDDEQDEFN